VRRLPRLLQRGLSRRAQLRGAQARAQPSPTTTAAAALQQAQQAQQRYAAQRWQQAQR
jgi:hypothetical protein